MLKTIELDKLLSHPERPRRMTSHMEKTLYRSIAETGYYKPLIIRPCHGSAEEFQIIDGHARAKILHSLGHHNAKCDIWDVDDNTTRLLLLAFDKLRGTIVPELKMNLAFRLLEHAKPQEIAAVIPEPPSYFENLDALRDANYSPMAPHEKTMDLISFSLCLSHIQHKIVQNAISLILDSHEISSRTEALTILAKSYLENAGVYVPITTE